MPHLVLGDLDHFEARVAQGRRARLVRLGVGERRVVALALDLDNEWRSLIAKVDPSNPHVAARVELATHLREPPASDDRGEPALEVAGRWGVIVTALVDEGSQHPEARPPLDARVIDEVAQRPARQQPPPPHVVDCPAGSLGMITGAQLEGQPLGPNDWYRVQDRHVPGQEAFDLVQHSESSPAPAHPTRPGDVDRARRVAADPPQTCSRVPARERPRRRVEHRGQDPLVSRSRRTRES
jgi:hypothetical protein